MTTRRLADATVGKRAMQVFEDCLELAEERRAAFLVEECGNDKSLREEVETLIRCSGKATTEELFPPLDLGPFARAAEPIRELRDGGLGRLRPGQRVGRHLVLEAVGTGGAATVYAAYDTVLERRIALKVLSAARSDPAATSRLVAEATALARVNHPNVVTVHDVGVVDDVPFVAMEYVAGVTLGEWRRQRSRSIAEILTVMVGVARGIAAAHRARIVHRDIKPNNILIDEERVLVTDFGLSIRDGSCAAHRIAGTPGYMAPEQYLGELATQATDVFGFCATLYELLYGTGAFGRGTLAEIRTRVTEGRVERPPWRAGVPRHVRHLLLAGLDRDPAARPIGMDSIATALLTSPPGRSGRRAALVAMSILFSVWMWRVGSTGRALPQSVSGPAWVQPPTPIPATFFGVTMNSWSGDMPSFRIGSVRFWDGRTRWANLQPARDQFVWTILDQMVASANRAGLPILFTIGGTPAWAAPNAPRAPYDDGSRAAPPDDLSDWEAFLIRLTDRYRNKIGAYETWVLADDPRFYNGSMETLVEMTRIAARVVKKTSPGATLVCPGIGRLWGAEGQMFLRRFAALGGYQHCDVANIKLYARSASDPPETMLELLATADRILHEVGVHPPVWNTGTRYEIPLAGSLDETTAINYAVRFFLVGLYARLPRMYFYNWGGTKIPIVLQPVGGAPTAAARAVQELETWLQPARVRSCGQGHHVALPDNTWQCQLTLREGARDIDAAIRWTHQGTALTATGTGAIRVRHLDGRVVPWPAGKPLLVTQRPVLIEWR